MQEFNIKVTSTRGLQTALEQVLRLGERDSEILKLFYKEFSGAHPVASVIESSVVGGEIVCVLTASDKLLEFLARHS